MKRKIIYFLSTFIYHFYKTAAKSSIKLLSLLYLTKKQNLEVSTKRITEKKSSFEIKLESFSVCIFLIKDKYFYLKRENSNFCYNKSTISSIETRRKGFKLKLRALKVSIISVETIFKFALSENFWMMKCKIQLKKFKLLNYLN